MRPDFAARVARARASLPQGYAPRRAAVLGSGLSSLADGLGLKALPFKDIEGFPLPSVAGHAGILYLGQDYAIMAGRFHYYEGWEGDEVVLPIFLLAALGVEELILTNAAGAVNLGYKPGDLVLINDHINLLGRQPFIGPNPQGADGVDLGPRFFDMGKVYAPGLRAKAQAVAQARLGHGLDEGVYAAMSGPAYETPAEIRMLRALGADLVGMSTVPEAIAGAYLGLKVLGLSCVTNMAAGILDSPLDHQEVIAAGKSAQGALAALLLPLLRGETC